jgi:3-isopropylmalate/(R)-2-methylmalate dehydratase small subunit
MKPTRMQGRIWLLTDAEGKLYDDVDTDMIFHNSHLHITDVAEMGQHTLGNLQGWEDFSSRCQPGDIVIAGGNFGSGSSRQQAVDCFRSLGVSVLIAESFGAIYKRNAVNSGFPILGVEGLSLSLGALQTGDHVQVDLETGEVYSKDGESFHAQPFSRVQMDIYQAGNLFAYGKTMGS